jgi:hypothetical protein
VGVDLDGLACALHRPTTYNHQTRGPDFLPGALLSYRVAAGDGPLLWDVKPPGLDICEGVDLLGLAPQSFTWNILLLPGYVYLMLESLWCVYV